jgi:PEGA domain-containing protein
MSLRLRKIAFCIAAVVMVCVAATAQLARRTNESAPPVSTDTSSTPNVPITLFNGETPNPYVRFTVGHSHAFSYCTGFLDINATTITYTSLTQASDSFSLPRSSVGRAYVRYKNWVVLPTPGRNYDFLLVPQTMVRGGSSNRDLYNRHFNPDPIMQAVNNWDSYISSLRRDVGVVYPPPIQKPIEPPKPVIGRLIITTAPGGAQVYVDDVFKGASSEKGLLTVEASPGSHMVRINHADYKEWSQSVYFANESGTPLSVTLVRNGPEPLSEDEIEQGLQAGITPARMTDKVKELGVNFTLNDDIEKKLRAAGADTDLLLEIAKNKR